MMLTYFYSRDNGPPYSTWLAYVDKKFDIPVNAILLTFAFTCCMSLINLGSKVAFEVMLSLATVALMSTYLMSIGCVLLKRLRGEELPPARWSLGRYGLAVNAVALLYTSWSVSRLPNRLLAFVSCQLMLSSVLLGLLADYLPHRQLYIQLGMSAVPLIPWVCAPDVLPPWQGRLRRTSDDYRYVCY
jgi:amino acid transporter